MSVGICKEHLYRTIRTKFSVMHQRDSLVFEQLGSRTCIGDFECKMMAATVDRSFVCCSCRSALIMFLDQMQQVKKMGPLGSIIDMIPGLGGAAKQAHTTQE